MNATNTILARLKDASQNANGWTASCPAHNDANSSLSISIGDDGNVSLKCSAGCETTAIAAAMGLQLTDLSPEKTEENESSPQSQGVTVHALANEKALPEDFLRGNGVKDIEGRAVGITYHLPDKSLAKRHRVRTALSAKDGSRWTSGADPIVPYGLWRLPDAHNAGYVVLVEGESDAWTLWFHDFPAMGIPGPNMTKTLTNEHLQEISKVYVVCQDGQEGEAFAGRISKRFQEIEWTGEAKMIRLPEGVKDPNELHKADPGAFKAKFQGLIDSAEPLPEPAERSGKKENTDEKKPIEILIELAKEDSELFHTPDLQAYATVRVKRHRETWAVRSRGYGLWLRQAYFFKTNSAPNKEAFDGALNQIEAQAIFGGEEHEVHTRVAKTPDSIFVDLADKEWRTVEITADGWRIVEAPTVRFSRSKGMLPLPEPERGGSVNEMKPFFNLADDNGWILILSWLVQSFRGQKPYPILAFQGEEGTAKSTTGCLLRSLVDPAKPPKRTPPKNEHDLMISAKNSWVLYMDNLSGMPDWLSDGCCRLSTGGGLGTRTLYSNDDETLFDAERPIILNGIDPIAIKQDLLSRMITLTLSPIPDANRKTEEELMAQFEPMRGRIVGALFDAVSIALGNLKSVKLLNMPRMADFAKWATAAEPGLGLEPGAFQKAYAAHRKNAIEEALEYDLVANAALNFMKNKREWSGTASDLLRQLGDDETKTDKSWPKAANKLSARLRRVATALRTSNIDVQLGVKDHEGRRIIVIRNMGLGIDRIVREEDAA